VVTADDIARLGLANLNQSLRYVAGVTPKRAGPAPKSTTSSSCAASMRQSISTG
jgi:hypothetical protein